MEDKNKIIKNYSLNLNDIIGGGSSSNVYKAKYFNNPSYRNNSSFNSALKPGDSVAIKVITLNYGDSKYKNKLKMLKEEAKIMNFIKDNPHRNIVKCYDVFSDYDLIHDSERIDDENDSYYIVMEHCESDLSIMVKRPMKEQYSKYYFYQLIEGFKYIRNNGIMHRDIKPKNILLTDSSSSLKIADFGLAKNFENGLSKTFCGSPLYMAPELINEKSYDEKADIWSMGIILFEMFYGVHPFKNIKTFHGLRKEISDNYISIPPIANGKKINKNISENGVDILRGMLQKNADDRLSWEQLIVHPWIDKSFSGKVKSNVASRSQKTGTIFCKSKVMTTCTTVKDDVPIEKSSSINIHQNGSIRTRKINREIYDDELIIKNFDSNCPLSTNGLKLNFENNVIHNYDGPKRNDNSKLIINNNNDVECNENINVDKNCNLILCVDDNNVDQSNDTNQSNDMEQNNDMDKNNNDNNTDQNKNMEQNNNDNNTNQNKNNDMEQNNNDNEGENDDNVELSDKQKLKKQIDGVKTIENNSDDIVPQKEDNLLLHSAEIMENIADCYSNYDDSPRLEYYIDDIKISQYYYKMDTDGEFRNILNCNNDTIDKKESLIFNFE